jgi:GNAT superfamily N-acetyltransferase
VSDSLGNNSNNPKATSTGQHSYEAARLHLAEIVDAHTLCDFYNHVEPNAGETETSMRKWLEGGGALVVENDDGSIVSVLRWRECTDGWQLDHIVTSDEYHNRGYGRWLMTKVEALAIQSNIATLHVALPKEQYDLEPYYQRMGYARDDGTNEVTLSKHVGGTWQYH